MEEQDAEHVPYCKPVRFIELAIAVTLLGCWSAKDLEAKYYDAKTYAIFIIIYITNGAFTVVFLIDIICQLSADPIDYTPMLLILLTATVLYVTCGVYISVLIGMAVYRISIILIVHIVLSFIMAVICLCDICCLIRRKCGYQ